MKFNQFIPARFRKSQVEIPVVRLAGVIAAANSPLRSNLNLASVAPLLEKAFTFKRSPIVAISINSPGGSPVQSRLIVSRIQELKKKHDKKVIIFVEDLAASGGYMISLAGDEIIADETSIVGSIGVVAAGFGLDKAIEKLGVERRVYTAGKNKVTLDPFLPEHKPDIDYLKRLQLEIHDIFIDMVKESRGDKLQEDKDMFTGRFWTGAKAKELGLIDELGHMSDILKQRYGDEVKLKLVQAKRGLFSRGGAVGIGNSEASLEMAPSEIGAGIADHLLSRIEEKIHWSRFGL